MAGDAVLIKTKQTWTADNSYLLEYLYKIETGEIVAGQELWKFFHLWVKTIPLFSTLFSLRFKKTLCPNKVKQKKAPLTVAGTKQFERRFTM